MKVVHLCLASFFIDHYSYQENMLPKFHRELGHDVAVIASLETFDKKGRTAYMKEASAYTNEHGVQVTRLAYRKPEKIYRKLRRYVGTYDALRAAAPDVLFIHGCQFRDMEIVVRYLKENPRVVTYVDNHADFSNSARSWLSKNVMHKVLWRHGAHMIEPFARKFYGVLPARVDFLRNIYRLPKEKCELLVMGADDEKVLEAKAPEVRRALRKKYGIAEDDFLIMTGGKIDLAKTQTLLLMEAVARIEDPNVKLLVFGSLVPELEERVKQLCVENKVMYIGWLQAEQTYQYFAAADLAVFPGRHSVFWEQVAGQGIPMLCKYWDGTTHVDLGGNMKFLQEDSTDEIYTILCELLEKPGLYREMKRAAEEKGMQVFSYRQIAKRSIEG